MELSVIGRRPVNFAPIATKLGAKGRGKCQLSFALFFSSILAFSAKRNISNFRSNSRRGTCNFKGGAIDAESGAIVKIYDSTFQSNTAVGVSA
jgi:hypothetical protein